MASVILGVVALLFMFGGLFLSWVPFAGTVLSFGAVLAAIAGIVTGGVAMSRAKQDGVSSGAATAGLIVSIIAVLPAIVIALTCGLCNACMSVAPRHPASWTDDGGVRRFRWGPPSFGHDAGQVQPPGFGPGPPPAFPPPPIEPAHPDPASGARQPPQVPSAGTGAPPTKAQPPGPKPGAPSP